MASYRLAPQAEADLYRIWLYSNPGYLSVTNSMDRV